MNLIIPYLFIGSYQDAIDSLQLKQNNIQSIVTTAFELPCPSLLANSLQIPCVKFSWDDTMSFNILKDLDSVTELIHTLRLKKKNVLVHCQMGISRSVSAVIAYLMRYSALTFRQAYNFVKLQRRIAYPNPHFIKQLIHYENILKNRRSKHYNIA